MASRALLLLRGGSTPTNHHCPSLMTINTIFSNPLAQFKFNNRVTGVTIRTCSSSAAPSSSSSLDPPDVSRLAQTARISLTPQEVEEFTPKIQQVVEWFGQLQDVELSSIEPALRADTDGNQLREDIPETFENREAMISSVPSYEEPFIKVPRVLSKE